MLTDLKIALRRLRRAPGFTAVAVLTLALAIGANTAVFSIADAVLFRPLPYENPSSLFVAMVESSRTGERYTRIGYDQVQLLQRLDGVVAGVGVLEAGPSLMVPTEAGTERVTRAEVSVDYFSLLGTRAALGRLFNEEDALSGGAPAVLTWRGFQQRFGGDESVIGSPVTLGSETFDIIGVLPADFVFPSIGLSGTALFTLMEPIPAGAQGGTFYPIVRLRPGVAGDQAEARIAAAVAAELPPPPGQDRSVPVLEDLRARLYPFGGPIMRLLLTASLLVLLLGCANLANMLLARTRLREREIGVQAALGAGRSGLLRPLMFEALLLGTAGAAAALAITELSFNYLLRQVPPAAVGQAPVGVGGRVLVFTFLLGVGAGLAFAALPAWRVSRLDSQALLRGRVFGTDKRSTFGRPMLAAQVGLAVVLVFGALIATRALVQILQRPLGFDPDNVITVSFFAPGEDGAARQNHYLRVLDLLRSRPDVLVAGAVGSLPVNDVVPDEGAVSPQSGEDAAGIFHVLPGYFEAAGIELVRGRLPTRADVDSGADIAVVTEAAAQALFGSGDALGATFSSNVGRPLTVVGVVEEVVGSLTAEVRPQAYAVPGAATRRMTLVIKARARNDGTLTEIRRAVSALAPGVPISAQWWSDQLSAETPYRNPRFQTLVLGSFAALALGLTALGVFGLVAFLVAARLRELGIRKAIGAGPAALILHALRHALAPTVVGLAAGLLATRALADLAAAQLYDVDTSDPTILAGAALSVAAAALVAAWLPARRAARVDPMAVLRAE